MSSLVNRLRSRPTAVQLGEGGETIGIRVQVPEVWDVVLIDAPPDTPVAVVKQRALDELVADAAESSWVVKLRGFEVLDEMASLAECGARDGSTLLVTSRRRRPVR